jgi:hypothetical protein
VDYSTEILYIKIGGVVNRMTEVKRCVAALFSAVVVLSFSTIYAEGQKESSPLNGGSFPSQELVNLFQKEDQFLGFKRVYGPTYYGFENLFNYINGGAELYLTYGFLELLVVEFDEDQDPVHRAVLEIYNMGTTENSFGVFKTEAGNKIFRLPGGTEGRLEYGLLQFYKGKFYVKIFLSPKSKAYPGVVKTIGTAVEARIKGAFSQPSFFALLPLEHRITGSEKYTSKDFLGYPFFKGIASADYKQGEKTYTLFVSVKPDREEAERSLQKYKEYLVNEKAYQDELKNGIKGFVGKDPYYGPCTISIIRGRIVGIFNYPENALSILNKY